MDQKAVTLNTVQQALACGLFLNLSQVRDLKTKLLIKKIVTLMSVSYLLTKREPFDKEYFDRNLTQLIKCMRLLGSLLGPELATFITSFTFYFFFREKGGD